MNERDHYGRLTGDMLDLPERIEAGYLDDLLVNLETACRNRRAALEGERS